VDTSVIVAWLDRTHRHHLACLEALETWARQDRLAVSCITLGELAAGGRTRDAVDEDLRDFEKIPLDEDAAWRAGIAFRQHRRTTTDDPVLPDFLIRAQAAVSNMKHLTNDRRRTRSFSDVDFEFVG
jgi:predicted nucleic acid-binding protein